MSDKQEQVEKLAVWYGAIANGTRDFPRQNWTWRGESSASRTCAERVARDTIERIERAVRYVHDEADAVLRDVFGQPPINEEDRRRRIDAAVAAALED